MRALPNRAVKEIRALTKAGATHRQIATITGHSKNAVLRHIMMVRHEVGTCPHGKPLWSCTYCHSRQGMKPLNELYPAIGLPVIWNVWAKRTDGSVFLYRMPLKREVAEVEVENLKNADPRCQIADAWFNRFHPDIAEGVSL